jgi:hypothetical protein
MLSLRKKGEYGSVSGRRTLGVGESVGVVGGRWYIALEERMNMNCVLYVIVDGEMMVGLYSYSVDSSDGRLL